MSYKLENLKGNVAVECHNSEEWEAVKKIAGIKYEFTFDECRSGQNTYGISVSKNKGQIGGHCPMSYYKKEGFTIIQAKDFIRDNSPEEEFKVGDWVKIIDSNGSSIPKGSIHQIEEVITKSVFGIEGFNFVKSSITKAAPHEIRKTNTKSEYIEKIEDLVVGKWYELIWGDDKYKFCFAGRNGDKIKASSWYRNNEKKGASDYFIDFGNFPIKEIPNPEEEIKQHSDTISESYKTLKKKDFYNCKIDVSESQELSKAVQEKLFELGCKWMVSGKKVIDCEFISIWYDGDLVYFSSKESFDENDKKQIYPNDLGINKILGNIIVKSSYLEPKVSDNQIIIPEIKKAIPNFNISIKPIDHIKLPDMSVKPKKVEKITINQFSLSI